MIFIHLLATCFLILGFRHLSQLFEPDVVIAYYNYGKKEYVHHLYPSDGITVFDKLRYSILANAISSLLALLISFSISLTICIKRKIFWLNSFIVLLIGLLIHVSGLLNFDIVRTTTGVIGNLFIYWGGPICALIINGVFLLIVSMFIYFDKWINDLIQKQYKPET